MERKNDSQITAKEICRKLNIPYSRVNHYTYLGLFSIVRKDGNRRLYRLGETKARYRMISKLATEGYPLSLIQKKLLGLMNNLEFGKF